MAIKWILNHNEVSVVIPGALSESQIIKNSQVSDIEDISHLMPRIKNIYDKYIKKKIITYGIKIYKLELLSS